MSRRTGRKRKPAAVTLPVIEVDNPLYSRAHDGADGNPKRIMAAYNPRESYCGWLFGRNFITEAEYKAATRVRQAFECLGGAGVGAIDYSRPMVDGGRIAEPISARQQEAGKFLKTVRGWIGDEDSYMLLLKLAGQGLWPHDIAPGDREAGQYFKGRIRVLLDRIAVRLGYQKITQRVAC